MIRCACDACVEVATAVAGWTSDGYCGFCAARCFPPVVVGATTQRVVMSRDSRLLLHGHATPRRAPASVPPADLLNAALRLVADPGTRRRVRAAVHVARVVGPAVTPAVRALAALVRRRP